eukprot:Em0003g992a
MAWMCKNSTQDTKQSRKGYARWVNESDKEQELVEDSDDECEEFPVHKIGAHSTSPYSVWVRIEDVKLSMEVDTGAAVSVVSNSVLQKYEDVFVEDVSEIKGFQAKLRVKANAVPRFLRARPIPFALKDAVVFKVAIWCCISTSNIMDEILQGISREVCYLDDILISGSSDKEHLTNLEEVLKRLREAGTHLLEYLGHVVSKEGLRTADSKVEAVIKARAPNNSAELRSFLALVHYYGKFMHKLAETLQPLNALLKKNARWEWTSSCEVAFQRVKDQLATAPVLCHYDPSLPLRLAGDASAYGYTIVYKPGVNHNNVDGLSRLPLSQVKPSAFEVQNTDFTVSVAPCELFMGRHLRVALDLLRPDLESVVAKKQFLQKDNHDGAATLRQFMVGQRVMVRNFREGPKWVPAIVKQKSGPTSYVIQISPTISVDQMRGCSDSPYWHGTVTPLPTDDSSASSEVEKINEIPVVDATVEEERQ